VFSSANSNAISVTDPDAGASDGQMTLGVTSGTLSLAGGAPTGPLTSVTGNGTATLVLAGTAAVLVAHTCRCTGPSLSTLHKPEGFAPGAGCPSGFCRAVSAPWTEVHVYRRQSLRDRDGATRASRRNAAMVGRDFSP